ncbi:thioesterase family protein [Actinoplanes subtropicus]|uniref:thioesterase family protein n=1 Tax=Actinoplanes subtropicus TaxID=543632 RepID=UPI0004C36CCE|nr:thioesterase family protein [Actinoplanes subtropicus]
MSFYQPLGDDHYAPTEFTESPWDSAMQHGGPPAALLGRLLRLDGLRLARITVDFLGPIPRREFRVEVSPLKPGRLTALNEARMVVDGRVAVTARAWHIAPGPQPPVVSEPALPPPLPEREDVFDGSWGYGRATEWRITRGSLNGFGETHAWTRVRIPLIDGAPIDGQDRALIVADSANGLSAELPWDKWLSIPPTLTATMLRETGDEWVHMACRTTLSDDGLGLAEATLSDSGGKIGQVAQPLLVRAR